MKKIFHLIASLTCVIFIAASSPVNAQSVIEGTWLTDASNYEDSVGQRYTFNFPPDGFTSSQLWGSGIYTTDCSIASAAVHSGLITPQNGGTVTIEIIPGQAAYEGSTRNGVTSSDWGGYHSSFIFINNRRNKQLDPNVIYGNWVTSASEYMGQTGQRYTYYFPKGFVTTGQVWGTGIYTTYSSIASAAVQSGLITTQNGGTVTIEILPGQPSYKGSTRNGVTSRDWMSYTSSFRFIPKRWRRY